MVTEVRQVFDLSDIKALRVQCSHCKGEVLYDPTRTKIPKDCPLCHMDWVEDGISGAFGAEHNFAQALRVLLKQDSPYVRVRIETGCEDE